MSNNPMEKFQLLLRELFQFESADLDFGIYRIMNYKREAIEQFITVELPKAVAKELEQGAMAAQSQAAKALEAARKKILDSLGEDAINADGNLAEQFRTTKAGKEYIAAQEQARSAKGQDALEAAIYNHLYAFFSRYYQDGDFISKRRYSKKEHYAIPYNGEEVSLYWANHDQYYIKTGEYFTNYAWKAPNGVTVHFKLKAADVEQNNVKGEKRFFLPCLDEIAWDEATHELVIPFEFRPLTAQEAITYGQKNRQETIIAKVMETVPKKLAKNAQALTALSAEKRRTDDGKVISHLYHHLRQYTRRNTSDFFIHKDLAGFLSRELDFYLKNEVLNLEEMEIAGQGLADGWFQLMRLIKAIGKRIIEFLAQIEEFQKMLWEKRKFVVETFYVITVGNIPEEFQPEITACTAQWEEWKAMLVIKAPAGQKQRVEFLRTHPSLPLDTRHFPTDFVDRLLAAFDNLDSLTDGLLVHGENWQALNLLAEKYREQVPCICIDPPYNTGSDGFIYKDNYKDSSWLTQQHQTLSISRSFLPNIGSLFAFSDENEVHSYAPLLRELFGDDNLVETIIWNKRIPKNDKGIGNIHDFIFLVCRDFKKRRALEMQYNMRKDELDEIYEVVKRCQAQGKSLDETQFELKKFYRKQSFDRGITLYCELDPNYEIWGKINMSWPNPKTEGPRYKVMNPVTGKPVPVPKNGWRWKKESFQTAELQGPTYVLPDGSMMKGRIWYPATEEVQPSSITYLHEVQNFLLRSILSVKSDGSVTLEDIGLGGKIDYPKPVPLMERLLFATGDNQSDILDYFAGSGTTGHAVISLNREDRGKRRFILVEMAQYFDTVLIPRTKKVTFTPEWKDGKPKRMATKEDAERGPRIIKIMRLESYEDTLNNLAFDDAGQMALQFEDYLLKYMLKWETRNSETLLNVELMDKPFSYKLHIYRDGETRIQLVDLPETFNYLIGLSVQTRRVYEANGRGVLVYRGVTREGRHTVIIWRETEGWTEHDYQRDRDFVAGHKLTDEADDIYVNGDSLIPEARALELLFKARMFARAEG